MYWLFILIIWANWSWWQELGTNVLHRGKKYCKVGWWGMEKNHTYLLKHIIVLKIFFMYLYTAMIILSDNIEKVAISITSRRINKCPTPKQRFSDKFPTARTYKMTNSWQVPGGGGDGHAWNWLRNPLSLISFEANFSFYSLVESPPHDLQMTAYKYNGLLMHNVVQLRLALSFSCK